MSRMRGEVSERTYHHLGKSTLTPRQREVLGYVADGFTDEHIARLIDTTVSTSRRHVRDILSKLDARNRANAVHIAHKKGILKWE